MDEIIMTVSKRYDITRDDILSSKRNSEIALARHICVYIARELTSLSQAQIAKALNRDRTTIISSEGVIKKKMEESSDFTMEINEILRGLKS